MTIALPPVAAPQVYTASFSLNEIIREAFDTIGVGSEGEAISADMYRRGKNSAQLMTLSWNAMDDLWRRDQIVLSVTAGQSAYPITPKPMRVMSARRKQSVGGYETPMTEWSRQEYLDMPSKTTSPSTPVNFYYEPQRDIGTLYLWPTPSVSVAGSISIIADVLRPMFLMEDSNDTIDMPAEWQETFIMNLAKRLKLKYPVNDPGLDAKVDEMADTLFARLKAWDNEPASMFLQPDDRGDHWHFGR